MRNHPLDSWYEPEDEQYFECKKCEEKDKELECAREFLEDIIEKLYGDSELDIARLDDSLGELCSYLGVKHPIKMPNIKREEVLQEWVKNNNNYLKQIA